MSNDFQIKLCQYLLPIGLSKSVVTIAASFLWLASANCSAASFEDTLLSKQKLTTLLQEIPQLEYKIVKRLIHVGAAYTQGLIIDNGIMFESTGLYGSSQLRRVDLSTGRVDKKIDFPNKIFAEGLALWQDTLHMLTWRNGSGYRFNKNSLQILSQFKHKIEGWGLASTQKYLVQSDGSDQLYFVNPISYLIEKQTTVATNGINITGINELEYINGYIWANIYPSDYVIIIRPESGEIVNWLDFSPLKKLAKQKKNKIDVLNGIAYDQNSNLVYFTGKLWPQIYGISIDLPVNQRTQKP